MVERLHVEYCERLGNYLLSVDLDKDTPEEEYRIIIRMFDQDLNLVDRDDIFMPDSTPYSDVLNKLCSYLKYYYKKFGRED